MGKQKTINVVVITPTTTHNIVLPRKGGFVNNLLMFEELQNYAILYDGGCLEEKKTVQWMAIPDGATVYAVTWEGVTGEQRLRGHIRSCGMDPNKFTYSGEDSDDETVDNASYRKNLV